MSATAAGVQLEAREKRDMLDVVERLNSGIHSVSDGSHYVTLLLAEFDARSQSLATSTVATTRTFIRATTRDFVPMSSSCSPVGMFDRVIARSSKSASRGRYLVLYTDGVTSRESAEEEFGWTIVGSDSRNSMLSADALMKQYP